MQLNTWVFRASGALCTAQVRPRPTVTHQNYEPVVFLHDLVTGVATIDSTGGVLPCARVSRLLPSALCFSPHAAVTILLSRRKVEKTTATLVACCRETATRSAKVAVTATNASGSRARSPIFEPT